MTAKTIPLGEICSITGGGTPDRGEPSYWGGAIPWASVKDMTSLSLDRTVETITPEGVARSATNLIPEGQIVVPTRMALGKVAINTVPLAINQDLKALMPKAGWDSRFLLWFLLSQASYLEGRGKGATVKGITLDVLRSLPVPNLKIDEQRRIAAILDKADAIRRKRQQALALADDFLRSAFLEMFGDPVTNPKGWLIVSLGDHLEYLTSGSRGWASYYDDDGQSIFIRIGNVRSNQLLMDDIQYINAPDNAEARRTRVKAGDVLLSITADLGRTAVIPDNMGTAYINQHLAIIRPKGIDSLFLSQFLASRGGQTQFKQLDRTGVKSGLNFDDIRSLRIPLPPLPQQRSFADLWKRVQSTSDELQKGIHQTDTLFASLSQRAFRGEL